MAFAASTYGVDLINMHPHGIQLCEKHPLVHLSNSKIRRFERMIRAGSQMTNSRPVVNKPEIDFSDPDWKRHFQEDFDKRFNLPHLRDILAIKPRPTTFSLKSRIPLDDGDGAATGSWNGYVNDDDRALLKVIKFASSTSAGAECIDPDCSWVEQWVHRAGPRKQIYFEPREVKAGIVTCGGLCPGLNDVIRQIVLTLEKYGVKNIVGIPYGYRGFSDEGLSEVPLSHKVVQNINLAGGSFLGVSRGGPSTSDVVDSIQAKRIDMLFVLGGDGTHAGALAIHNECRMRKLKVSVVCVPKTIDNDILLMDKTFGFDTAVEEAQRVINSAYVEARSAYHGIGLVKLMGRSSGFIAMHASLSSGQIDICLIPEVPFNLEGPNGVLQHLEHLIKTKGNAVVCVAEGAGQDYLHKSNTTDASGNVVLSDIGVHIQQQIKRHFKDIGVPADVKYIDPTYMIRACRANASDAILCTVLGQNALLSMDIGGTVLIFSTELQLLYIQVHGAFAGFSGITTGICNTHYVYFPITQVIESTRHVDPNSRMWHRCLTSTGQPDFN
nr:PREDICTED: ATP-dependent 6-phosphofructokinase 5, chloroplastic-like isoform X2 [Musa acuminata subsp. malaccensis]XP_018683171.1 PREDICTED: ATP-dependent 6-phosphofructokinase 5, chloroplastic-like isoform X2 [Musa acuminata subsp. malaccensis]XP_018683177.1 PREDICTED: ATP-dependent 6-phosphofructokinase 5, chloroplastic-like isoform X2 [Musa acuminata subsp. malaccensis]